MAALLLDTHVALWWFSAHPRLDPQAQALIADSECHLSAASIWEVAIKFKLGKLPVSPHELVSAARDSGMRALAVTQEHGMATAELPPLHSDPFDRLLVAQARIERLRLVTGDHEIGRYGGDIQLL